MNFQASLQTLLEPIDVEKKLTLFGEFYEAFLSGSIAVSHEKEPIVFIKPSYSEFCEVVDIKNAPNRHSLQTAIGRQELLHNLTHIEFSAIDLALDAAYRFGGLPIGFYRDWLEVAAEEIKHFLALRDLLEKSGAKYGDFKVHNGLFEAMNSHLTLVDRMAIVPRGLEANGLDANAGLVGKVKAVGHIAEMRDLLTALETILHDEIDHVRKGDRWYKHACEISGLDAERYYYDLLVKNKIAPIKRAINFDARIAAGFSEKELRNLTSF